MRLRDLNWYRYEKLRSLLAGLYDASHLTNSAIKAVEVVINQPKPSPTSLLLAGWLSEIMGKKDIVKIVPVNLNSGESNSFLKVIVKGSGFEIAVSQDKDQFQVFSGESVRKLILKPLTTAQLIFSSF